MVTTKTQSRNGRRARAGVLCLCGLVAAALLWTACGEPTPSAKPASATARPSAQTPLTWAGTASAANAAASPLAAAAASTSTTSASAPAPTQPNPHRVITFAPSVTESVFAMGEGDRVVGISDWCHYPPESQDRARCGGAASPNFEAVVGLHPDLVIVLGQAAKMADFCKARGIPLLRVTMNSVAEIRTDLLRIGVALGAPAPARALADRIANELAAVKSDLPSERCPRVFLCLSRPPGPVGSLMTAGGGTFLDEVVTLAGGRSVFADLKEYPTVSKETLVMQSPDAILELRPEETVDEARARELDSDWAPLSSVPAVRDGRIAYITEGFVLQPGPRVAETVRILKHAMGTDTAEAAAPKDPLP